MNTYRLYNYANSFINLPMNRLEMMNIITLSTYLALLLKLVPWIAVVNITVNAECSVQLGILIHIMI